MSELDLLLHTIDQAYGKKAWHGTNLRGSLRRVTAELASFRPGRERHNVWELALHCAYWKYTIWRLLTGERKGSFPIPGSNFFRRPEGKVSDDAWRADLSLLDATHAKLRAAVGALTSDSVDKKPAGSSYRIRELLVGIASHDLYHAGQIQLIKRLGR